MPSLVPATWTARATYKIPPLHVQKMLLNIAEVGLVLGSLSMCHLRTSLLIAHPCPSALHPAPVLGQTGATGINSCATTASPSSSATQCCSPRLNDCFSLHAGATGPPPSAGPKAAAGGLCCSVRPSWCPSDPAGLRAAGR